MAEHASSDGLTRRSSFRKSLAEAGLPADFLEALEQKRRQLDDSIHKYIAAKEREYKQYEKEVRQQYKIVRKKHDSGAEAGTRRTSSESTYEGQDLHELEGIRASAVDALLANGVNKGSKDSHAIDDDEGPQAARTHQELKTAFAGLTDRRASMEREKEFVGLFTPSFLPALDHKDGRYLERTTSAPTSAPPVSNIDKSQLNEPLHRAHSDTMVQAKPKRPSQLLLAQRTSSSGSSADGRLPSALKSPTASQRSRRKRVSLAVGDVIVAPADNVPVPATNNRRASHSRLRSPAPDHDRLAELEETVSTAIVSAPPEPSPTKLKPSAALGASLLASNTATSNENSTSAVTRDTKSANQKVPNSPNGDIGDMFFDEDDEDDNEPRLDEDSNDENEDENIDMDEDSSSEIAGRVGIAGSRSEFEENSQVDSAAVSDDEAIDEEEENEDSTIHLEPRPGATSASRQPIAPGFRRPSVSADPAFQGQDYVSAAQDAEENGVYGSSYVRPAGKGSFAAGSLGESYMARHAEEMMKLRAAQQQQHVR